MTFLEMIVITRDLGVLGRKYAPNRHWSWSLRERYLVVLGELLNDPGDCYSLAVCDCPDECDGGLEGVAPVVVGAPPGHFVEQVWVESAPY